MTPEPKPGARPCQQSGRIMDAGLHVHVQKPLTRDIYEARRLTDPISGEVECGPARRGFRASWFDMIKR